jgi:hypothetical protein
MSLYIYMFSPQDMKHEFMSWCRDWGLKNELPKPVVKVQLWLVPPSLDSLIWWIPREKSEGEKKH